MAIIVLDTGQSSSAVSGQSTTYIVDKILTRSPAIPDPIVNSELQDTIRHFYTMSTGWRDNIGPYNVAAGQPTIQLNPINSYKQLQYVLAAWLYPGPNGANFPQRLRLSPRLIVGPDIGPPTTIFMEKPDRLRLYPVPDKNYGQTLFAYAVLLPTVNTVRLPNISITNHLDALMWGTMARLYRMKGKPWSDATLAAEYSRMYRQEILRVRDEANRAYSGAQGPAMFPAFAPKHLVGSPWAVAG
jgi:hypothetical protein